MTIRAMVWACTEAARAWLVRLRRRAAFRRETDSLYFKVARGEITEDEWLDKVQEIRDRFPHFYGPL